MSMEYYRGMLIQSTRMDAFRNHLKNVVRPTDHVLEIGAGLGTYSFFAARAGAARVTAVEGSTIAAVAKAVARTNDLGDRVEFIRGWYPKVEIPAPVDLVIFEDYPSRLLDAATYNMLRHMNEEFLATGARLVPNRAKLFLEPVFSGQNWRVVGPLGGMDDTLYGVDWASSREYVYNTPLQMPLSAEDNRHEAREIADVRLDRLPNASDLAGGTAWEFDTETTINGLAYWFELEVGEGVWLSSGPGRDPGSWGYLYLPIPELLAVKEGQVLEARVAPEVKEGGAPGWLTWDVRSGDWHFAGHEFKSFAASLSDIIPSSASWIPELSDEGRIEQRILEATDGVRSVEEIAQAIQNSLPQLTADEIRSYVLQILRGRTTGKLAVRRQ